MTQTSVVNHSQTYTPDNEPLSCAKYARMESVVEAMFLPTPSREQHMALLNHIIDSWIFPATIN